VVTCVLSEAEQGVENTVCSNLSMEKSRLRTSEMDIDWPDRWQQAVQPPVAVLHSWQLQVQGCYLGQHGMTSTDNLH
jgi:hypothetical protein